MKKIFILFLLLMLCTPVFAENTIRRIGDERVEYYNGRIVGIGNKTVTYNED